MLASFGQGSNSIKSAEQGAGLGLPIAKSLIDMHGGTFTLKSKLRIGTEVIVTFPPERVMSALAPMAEEAPPLQPEPAVAAAADDKRRARHKPIMSAGTGSVTGALAQATQTISLSINEQRNAVYRSLHDGPQNQTLLRLRTNVAGDRALASHGDRGAIGRDGRACGAHGGGRPRADAAARRARLIPDEPATNRRRRAVIRVMLVLAMLAATAGAVVAYGDPDQIARASNSVTKMLRQRSLEPAPAVQIARGKAGEFALHAKINGVKAPMVIDTGATSVVLTWETAKAIGLPIEMLEYNVDVETAGGHTKAARLTLDRLAVGGLVEKSIPALVVPRGQMKTNLLGMSFLDRLESWGVQADKVMLHGYPDVAGRNKRRAAAN